MSIYVMFVIAGVIYFVVQSNRRKVDQKPLSGPYICPKCGARRPAITKGKPCPTCEPQSLTREPIPANTPEQPVQPLSKLGTDVPKSDEERFFMCSECGFLRLAAERGKACPTCRRREYAPGWANDSFGDPSLDVSSKESDEREATSDKPRSNLDPPLLHGELFVLCDKCATLRSGEGREPCPKCNSQSIMTGEAQFYCSYCSVLYPASAMGKPCPTCRALLLLENDPQRGEPSQGS